MIFVTIGMQLPFPRLLTAMDRIAGQTDEPVVAQTGPHDGKFETLTGRVTLPPAEFDRTFAEARVVVSHAGIGTILSAKKMGKPLILFPRRLEFSEHRNDHQLSTARHLEAMPGIHVAWTEDDLERLIMRQDLCGASDEKSPSHATLINRIDSFLRDRPLRD